jgi:hypothetical protein
MLKRGQPIRLLDGFRLGKGGSALVLSSYPVKRMIAGSKKKAKVTTEGKPMFTHNSC